MNPNSKEFYTKNHREPFHISTGNLSPKQIHIFQELILEWTTSPTLELLLTKWEERKKTTFKMLNTKTELQIMLLNVSSLRQYLSDIFLLLENTPCPIVVFNGTHHHLDTIKVFSKHFNNYNVYWKQGSNIFGGVLIATHRSIPVQKVEIFQNHPNVLVLDIGTSTDKFQLATCYSPPNEKLPLELFNRILDRNTNTILLGDLNAKHRTWSDSIENQKGRILLNWLTTNDLHIVNKHVATSTRSNATIDLILAPVHMISTTSSYSVLPSIGNDHFPVVWTPTMRLKKSDCQYPIKRTYWTLVEMFLAFTFSYWKDLFSNIDDNIYIFSTYERFLSLLGSRLTFVSFCNAYKPSLPPNIINLILQKKVLLRLARKTKHPFYIIQLKMYSRTIRKEIYTHKRSSWQKYCSTLNGNDLKQFWTKARRHFSVANPPIDGFLLTNGNVASSPKEMCDIGRAFYEEQFAKHPTTSDPIETEAECIVEQLELEIQHSNLSAPIITLKEISKTVSLLKNKSSSGLDGVSNKIIKLLPTSHHSFICCSFNYFMSNLCMPPHWKTAKIILLTKTKTNTVNINDTRPISLLPCFSKLYEKVFLKYFYKWINDNAILPDEQTGFRKGHNMAVRLVSIVDQIGQCLSLNTATAGVFIDFKSAFNQLWFNGLILKLHRLNCPIYILAWLHNYLTGRSAFIDIKGSASSMFLLHKGVPQGSCLGPVIFIAYHHDILNSISMLHWKHLFADDLAVLICSSANWSSKVLIPNLIKHIEEVIISLISYSTTWKQPINFQKTYWMLFHRQIAPILPNHINCSGHVITHCDKFKYLGTFLDSKLSFSSHLSYVESKIKKNLTVFKYLTAGRMLTEDSAYRLYNAYIRPYFQSVLNIYPILSKTKQNNLEALNRKIFRTMHQWHDATNDEILNLPKYKSIDQLTQAHWKKVTLTILRINPAVLDDFLQHKMYLIYMNDYYKNPDLIKEKRSIVNRGRTSKRILNLFIDRKHSLFDYVLCF